MKALLSIFIFFAIQAYQIHANADTAIPVASITSPSAGQVVSEYVDIKVTAFDDIGVTKVVFAVDNQWVGKDTSAPYNFRWNSISHANGEAKIRATAFDAAGNQKEAFVYVTVNNVYSDLEAPNPAITSPSNGSILSGTVNIQVNALDNIGVTKVVFAIDDKWAGRDLTPPFTFLWDSSTHADGQVKIKAIAYDAAGNKKSTVVFGEVRNNALDTENPSVLIFYPTNNNSVTGSVEIQVAAMDNVGITKVTFAIDDVWVGKDETAPYSFNWDSTSHNDGQVKITATAFDEAGNSSEYTTYLTAENTTNQSTIAANQSLYSFDCFGCDETNSKEVSTIEKYNISTGLFKAESLWRIPGLEENYIPQGIHVTNDEFVYMSMYYKDKDGKTTEASIIIKYDPRTQSAANVYHLKNSDNSKFKGHVGGLVVSGDYFIVPNGNKLYFFNHTTSTPLSGIEREIKMAFVKAVNLSGSAYNFKISFISTSYDHLNQLILWTGQFSTSTTSPSHIIGYKVKADGTVELNPSYQFYVPETVNKLQGVAILKATNDSYTILASRSYGSGTSYLYKLNYTRNESEPYKYAFSSKSITYKGPAGLEDLHITSDGVWSLSESGANYFQNRPSNPWSQYFPFIIKLKKSEL